MPVRLAVLSLSVLALATGCASSTEPSSSAGASASTPAAAPTTGSPTSSAPTSGSTSAPAPADTSSAPAAPAGLADGSFTSKEPTSVKSSFGICQASSRIVNTSDEEKSATFTYTLLKGGESVGTLSGAANAVGAGKTATVQLIGQESCPKGDYDVEFQVDAEF